jgi:hypothetical protein
MVSYLKEFNQYTISSKSAICISIAYSSKKSVFLIYLDSILINFFVLSFVFNKFISRRSSVYVSRVLPFLDTLGFLDY